MTALNSNVRSVRSSTRSRLHLLRRRPRAAAAGSSATLRAGRFFATALLFVASFSSCRGTDEATVVVAASSLREVFHAIEQELSNSDPALSYEFSFASSSTVVRQVREGVEPHLVATADVSNMDEIRDEIDGRTLFARSELVLAINASNPVVDSIDDLTRSDVVLAACVPEAPCGRFADAVLKAAQVKPSTVTRESNVKAVVSKVALGEADAGFVYASDLVLEPQLARVALPDVDGVRQLATYEIAMVNEQNRGADEFLGFLMSERGRVLLSSYGFIT